jgi:FlaG/FlaF family flagellin (archaellin)
VGPVIGVVLLVAIVIVLAAAVSSFAMGFGDETNEPAPRFATAIDYNRSANGQGQYLEITHDAGERVATDDVRLVITGASSVSESDATDRRAVELASSATIDAQVGTHLTASETIRLDKSSFVERGTGSAIGPNRYLDLSDAMVRIVWRPGPEHSETLLKWEDEDV